VVELKGGIKVARGGWEDYPGIRGRTDCQFHYFRVGRQYTACHRVAKKLHNLFVIKDINFYFFLD
jgi:hypothetical protein